jgi:adenylosuccinate synthase
VGELPRNARAYLDRMSELTGLPVSLVGVGPDREQTLVV